MVFALRKIHRDGCRTVFRRFTRGFKCIPDSCGAVVFTARVRAVVHRIDYDGLPCEVAAQFLHVLSLILCIGKDMHGQEQLDHQQQG